jgi:hypothetical protein
MRRWARGGGLGRGRGSMCRVWGVWVVGGGVGVGGGVEWAEEETAEEETVEEERVERESWEWTRKSQSGGGGSTMRCLVGVLLCVKMIGGVSLRLR